MRCTPTQPQLVYLKIISVRQGPDGVSVETTYATSRTQFQATIEMPFANATVMTEVHREEVLLGSRVSSGVVAPENVVLHVLPNLVARSEHENSGVDPSSAPEVPWVVFANCCARTQYSWWGWARVAPTAPHCAYSLCIVGEHPKHLRQRCSRVHVSVQKN